MHIKRECWLLVVASAALGTLAMAGLCGCGRSGIPMAKVYGEAKYDGKAIEKGTIIFQPADGKGPSAGGEIKQGQFSVLVPPGMKRIEVRSPKVIGKSEPSREAPEGIDITEEVIPPAYNIRTTLSEEVKMPSTTINLDLKPIAGKTKR